MSYHSEAAKVRDMPNVMKYVSGDILDVGCGPDKITPEAWGFDGRKLPGVNFIHNDPYDISDWMEATDQWREFDTIFSSHFLEHCANQYGAIESWTQNILKPRGHLVLYLPDGRHYNNQENPEHMIDMNYDQFIFWFKRAFCGEGKDFRGEHLPKMFDLVDSGMDVGPDRYSFYVIARKV
jgi:SAM-dependent methyltransferase